MSADREAAAVQAVAEALQTASSATVDMSKADAWRYLAEVAVAAAWPHIAAAIADAIESAEASVRDNPSGIPALDRDYRTAYRYAARLARSTKPTGETT